MIIPQVGVGGQFQEVLPLNSVGQHKSRIIITRVAIAAITVLVVGVGAGCAAVLLGHISTSLGVLTGVGASTVSLALILRCFNLQASSRVSSSSANGETVKKKPIIGGPHITSDLFREGLWDLDDTGYNSQSIIPLNANSSVSSSTSSIPTLQKSSLIPLSMDEIENLALFCAQKNDKKIELPAVIVAHIFSYLHLRYISTCPRLNKVYYKQFYGFRDFKYLGPQFNTLWVPAIYRDVVANRGYNEKYFNAPIGKDLKLSPEFCEYMLQEDDTYPGKRRIQTHLIADVYKYLCTWRLEENLKNEPKLNARLIFKNDLGEIINYHGPGRIYNSNNLNGVFNSHIEMVDILDEIIDFMKDEHVQIKAKCNDDAEEDRLARFQHIAIRRVTQIIRRCKKIEMKILKEKNVEKASPHFEEGLLPLNFIKEKEDLDKCWDRETLSKECEGLEDLRKKVLLAIQNVENKIVGKEVPDFKEGFKELDKLCLKDLRLHKQKLLEVSGGTLLVIKINESTPPTFQDYEKRVLESEKPLEGPAMVPLITALLLNHFITGKSLIWKDVRCKDTFEGKNIKISSRNKRENNTDIYEIAIHIGASPASTDTFIPSKRFYVDFATDPLFCAR